MGYSLVQELDLVPQEITNYMKNWTNTRDSLNIALIYNRSEQTKSAK